ncbi:MAG TPA: alpha/beta fold hydrolase [Anaerolineales bacterium]|nr:alpha/beta fold hydrolase [Anaerolineales bacterium]
MLARVNNFSMAYDDQGGGRPLLLIHGFPLNRNLWEPQISDLSAVGRILAPDLRGHGGSEAVSGPYSMDLLAGDCNALLDEIEIEQPAVICGLSMGGYITLAFYRRYPQRVAGLILAATRAGADSAVGKANRDKMASLAKEQGAGAVAAELLPKMLSPRTYAADPELVERVSQILKANSVEGIIGDLMGMKGRPDSTVTLQQINVPTLIIHGVDDQLIPLAEAESMHAAIQDSRLHVVAEAGHLLNLEQPDVFNQAVREFLQSI